jgi:hypothetical protein
MDLGEADALVLSHGHYDHTGGVAAFLRVSRAAEIHCHPGIALARYAIREGKAKPIGMPREALAALEKLPAGRLHPVDRAVMLSERVGLTGPIPRATGFEDTGGPFFLDPEGRPRTRSRTTSPSGYGRAKGWSSGGVRTRGDREHAGLRPRAFGRTADPGRHRRIPPEGDEAGAPGPDHRGVAIDGAGPPRPLPLHRRAGGVGLEGRPRGTGGARRAGMVLRF